MRRLTALFLIACSVVGAAFLPPSSIRASGEPGVVVVQPDGTTWLIDGTSDAHQARQAAGIADAQTAAVMGGDIVLVRRSRLWAWQPYTGRTVPLSDVAVRDVSCAKEHCLAVTLAGRVVEWTRGATPELAPGIADVSAVAAGARHKLAVTHAGQLYTWGGAAEHGELGRNGDPTAPAPVANVYGVVSVAAGGHSSMAVLADGSVLAFGSNDQGQLGLGDFLDRTTPTKVPGVRNIVRAATSGARTALLDDRGELWVFGAGDPQPRRLTGPGELVDVRIGQNTIVATRSDGRLWLSAPSASRFLSLPVRERELPATAESTSRVSIAGRATLVVGAVPLAAADEVIERRLKMLGLAVDVLLARDANLAAVSAASVVVISASVNASALSPTLADAPVPIVTWERFAFRSLGMTSVAAVPSHGSTTGRLSIIRPDHPLAAGLSGDRSVMTTSAPMVWGAPTGDAQVVAVGPMGQASVFGYERGASLTTGTAPARRVGLFLPSTAHGLTSDGDTLFDAAIGWAAGAVAAPTTRKAPADGGIGTLALTGGSGTILFVVGNLALSPSDFDIHTRMTGMGYTVVTSLAETTSASQAFGRVLVYVSSSSPNAHIGGKFTHVAVPVIVQTAGVLDDMKMTEFSARGFCGPGRHADVVTPTHPIAVGRTGTQLVITVEATHEWGTPSGSGSRVLSCVGESTWAVTFTYAQGAAMAGLNAPARRALWGFRNTNDLGSAGVDMFERLIFWATGTNAPPSVTAGPDLVLTQATPTTTLNGSVADDGLPSATLSRQWTRVSGPSGVTFGSPSSAVTTVTFSTSGTYVLRLTASDGALTAHDDASVQVFVNTPPVVHAGSDAVVYLPDAASLNGSASDDGYPIPPGALTRSWSKATGPGTVTFASPTSAITTATFSSAGTYVLRLTASDGAVTVHDDVTVQAILNTPPAVHAGADVTALLSDTVTLEGSATDDGIPNPPGVLTKSWTKESGPGTVTFASAANPTTTVQFSAAGVYTLRLTANDSRAVVFDEVVVTVRESSAAEPLVWTRLIGVAATGPNGLGLTKAAGTGWTASAMSTRAIGNGSGSVEFVAGQANATLQVGLSHRERTERVIWTNLVGAGASSTLTKVQGSAWDASASSVQTITSGDGYVEFSPRIGTTCAVGLSREDTSTSYQDLKHGFWMADGGTLGVIENGTALLSPTWTYTNNDRLRVAVESGVVRYRKNGTLLYTSATAASFPLRADASIHNVQGVVEGVVVSAGGAVASVVWTNAVGTIAGENLTKVGTTAGWNAGATSDQVLTGDGYLEFSAKIGTNKAIGLGTQDTSTGLVDIRHGFWLADGGTLGFIEGGAALGTPTSAYVAGDRLRVAVESGVVRFRKNGRVIRESALAPAFPLRVDTSLHDAGATLEKVVLANTAAPLADVDFGLRLEADGQVRIFEAGHFITTAGSYSAGDRFRIGVEGTVVRYRRNGDVIATGTRLPRYPLLVDASFETTGASIDDVTLRGVLVENVQWTGHVQTNATGNTVWNASGADGWNAMALAVQKIQNGDGYLEFSATETDGYRIAGLTSGTTTLDSNSVGFGVYTTGDGMVRIIESGNVITNPATGNFFFGPYTPADRLRVGVEGGKVRYRKNGTLLYQSTRTPAFPLTGHVTIAWEQSSVTNAIVAGGTPLGTPTPEPGMHVATPTISVPSGSYATSQTVVLATETPFALLYYTLDGSEPSSASPYVTSGGSVSVGGSAALRVKGMRYGWTPSAVKSAWYQIRGGPVAAPTFDPPPGAYMAAQQVAISSTTAGATIRYTTDGTEPTLFSSLYSAPVAIEASTTLKARAFKTDWQQSSTATGNYVVNLSSVCTPTVFPPSGVYSTRQSVVVNCDTLGATIHYRTDGRVPTELDPVVVAGGTLPLVDRDSVIRIKARKTGLAAGKVTTAAYVITGAIAAGDSHSLALKSDRTVWFWGYAGAGNFPTPVQVADPSDPSTFLTDIVAISARGTTSLALKANGTVRTWRTGAPAAVPGLTEVVAIAAGAQNLALKKDGTVWSWTEGTTPVAVPGLSGATALVSGAGSPAHRLALQTDGALVGAIWAWGDNTHGQLGDGGTTASSQPVRVAGTCRALAAGATYSLGICRDALLFGWGNNAKGTLGDGTTSNRLSPTPAVNPVSFIRVASGTAHNLAIDAEAHLWAWGDSQSGRLGRALPPLPANPFVEQPNRPVRVTLSGVADVAAGGNHSLALRADGTIWSFGLNDHGQAGTGAISNAKLIPTLVASLRTATNIDDLDGDGLRNAEELRLGSDPGNPDTNGDGIPDGVAAQSGRSLLAPDMDDDGAPNATELANGTNPFVPDTDGDGVVDGADFFPLDPSRHQRPMPAPCPPSCDETAPTITLTEPTNAVLVHSAP